jgi:hypothetical protein
MQGASGWFEEDEDMMSEMDDAVLAQIERIEEEHEMQCDEASAAQEEQEGATGSLALVAPIEIRDAQEQRAEEGERREADAKGKGKSSSGNGRSGQDRCPTCQALFECLDALVSHSTACIESFRAPALPCRAQGTCKSLDPRHYLTFSHHTLAKSTMPPPSSVVRVVVFAKPAVSSSPYLPTTQQSEASPSET